MSVPNTVLPLFGGIILSKVGKGNVGIVVAILVTVGQFLTYMGAKSSSFWLMIVGRGIYGVGGETMWVTQTLYISQWFYD